MSRGRRRWGVLCLSGGLLACAADGLPGASAGPPPRTEPRDVDVGSPRGLCLDGCARVRACDVGRGGEAFEARMARCEGRCNRLGPAAREGMAHLRACLAEERCEGFSACLAAEEGSREPSVPVSSLPGAALDDRCERHCGLVGDCLRETERETDRDAAALELSCLEMCVVAEPDSARGQALDACSHRETCSDLLDCTADAWGAGTPRAAAPAPGQRDYGSICRRLVECLVEETSSSSGAVFAPTEQETIITECTRMFEEEGASARPEERRRVDAVLECVERETCQEVIACFSAAG